MLCDDLDMWDGGKEIQEWGDIRINIADSLYCTAESNTAFYKAIILQSNNKNPGLERSQFHFNWFQSRSWNLQIQKKQEPLEYPTKTLSSTAFFCRKTSQKSVIKLLLYSVSVFMLSRSCPTLEFPRQEYWGGLPFPSPGDLPEPGIESLVFVSLASAGGFFTTSVTREDPHQVR